MGIQTASQAFTNEFGGLSSPFTFRNRVINGDYQFSQREQGAALTNLSSYNYRVADMARTGGGAMSTGRYSYQRMTSNNSAATGYEVGSAPNGFSNSVKLTVTATESESASAGSIFHSHFIEGYGVADFGMGTTWAKPFTVSFWVKSSVTGTYSILINNSASPTGCCYVTYTINAANTWEYKTINVPAATTTTAPWNYTNGAGLRFDFKLKADSTTYNNSVATNVWLEGAAADNKNVIGSVNLFATNGATWYMTGLQVELGTTATPFERRPYSLELSLCQRYFETSYAQGTPIGTTTEVGSCMWLSNRNPGTPHMQVRYVVPKRATATFTTYNTSTGTANSIRDLDASANYTAVWGRDGPTGGTLYHGTSTTLGNFLQFHYTASSEF